MDLFRFLLKDQRSILARLTEIRGTTYRATQTRRTLLRDVKELLEAHAQFEEGVLYPLLKKHRSIRPLLKESERDHKQIKTILRKWIAVPPNDDEWERHFREASALARKLLGREKAKLFPEARRLLKPEQLEDMSTRVQESRNELNEAKLRLKISEE